MIRLREDAGNAPRVPGSRWLATFPDDPDRWHERVFAWPFATSRWVVRTADGDQYVEALGPLDTSGRYPDGEVQVVPFSRGLTRDEMQECVRDGASRGGTDPSRERWTAPQEPTVMIDWWGAEEAVPGNCWIGGAWRRIRGKQVVQRPKSEAGVEDNPQPNLEGSFRRRSASVLASPVVGSEGEMWLVCESSGPAGYELGVEVEMGALCVQRGRGLRQVRAGQHVCVELVRARDLESWQRKRQLLDERSGCTEARAGELLREDVWHRARGVVRTREHGCPPRRRQPARAKMPSRKTFEHSG